VGAIIIFTRKPAKGVIMALEAPDVEKAFAKLVGKAAHY
jgi:hypothetical protein